MIMREISSEIDMAIVKDRRNTRRTPFRSPTAFLSATSLETAMGMPEAVRAKAKVLIGMTS